MSCGLGEIGTQSSMLLQIKDMTTLPSRDLIKKQGKIPVIPKRKGAICPSVSDRERYKTRHTVERFFAHIKEHMHASISWMQPSFFSLSLASMCLKYFVNIYPQPAQRLNKITFEHSPKHKTLPFPQKRSTYATVFMKLNKVAFSVRVL